MGEDSLCLVGASPPHLLSSPPVTCEYPGPLPRPCHAPTSSPQCPLFPCFGYFSLSPSLLLESGVGAQDPAAICPDPHSASHAPVACQSVYVLVQEIKDLCATWPNLCRLSQGVHMSVCVCAWVCVHEHACVCLCACVHALRWGKAMERGWALVLNDVLWALIKYIIIATNPSVWVI